MSAEKARMVYGFHNVHSREDLLYRLVNEEADFLKDTVLQIANMKDKALLETQQILLYPKQNIIVIYKLLN